VEGLEDQLLTRIMVGPFIHIFLSKSRRDHNRPVPILTNQEKNSIKKIKIILGILGILELSQIISSSQFELHNS